MSPDLPPDAALLARLDALERRVALLEAERRRAPAPLAPPRPAKKPSLPLTVRWAEVQSEDVLGKVGIALLLVGVLFLLKYTLDRDLLTPAVRVAGAGVIGLGLVGLGLRLRRQRRTLGRLLTGGGIAALYGALWTASLLYPLLPLAVAFAGMATVAALAFLLAVREGDAALSVVGTLGGLMTPLLLYREAGQMAALVGYAAVVLGGAAFVYARQGWRELLGAAALGGWGVMLVAWLVGVEPVTATAADRAAFTVGVLVVWGVTGLLPLWRLGEGRLHAGAPERPRRLFEPEALSVLAAPLLAFGFLDAAWAWPTGVAVALALAGAAAYGVAARLLRRPSRLFAPLVLAAAALAAWGAGRALGESDARTLGAIVALGCAVVAVARRTGEEELGRVGHVAALGASGLLVIELFFGAGAPGTGLAADTWREALAALGAAVALGAVGFTSAKGSRARAVYLTTGHAVVLLLLRVLLRPLPQGAALTSTAWAVYAVGAIAAGLRLRDDVVRQIGLGTVLATVAKVLLLDLSTFPTLWRVLLFMGLGALLLLVSYLVPSLLRGSPSATRPPDPA